MLELENLIQEIPLENSIDYKITERGNIFLNEYKNIISNKINVLESTNFEIENWIEDWIKLWKDKNGIFFKTPDRRSLGINKKDALAKMKWFLENYQELFDLQNSPKETILGATKEYIEEYKKVNFAFCKRPNNFISKREDRTKDSLYSTLAAECENFIANKGAKKKSVFKRST